MWMTHSNNNNKNKKRPQPISELENQHKLFIGCKWKWMLRIEISAEKLKEFNGIYMINYINKLLDCINRANE